MLTTSYPGGVLLPTLTIVNADGARVPNQALHKALLELSGLTSGQRLANANLRESVYRIFLGDKLMDGYVIANGEAEPVGSFDGQILLIGAKYGESPDVEIVEQVKLWNSSSSSWVEPNPSLFAKALLHLSGTTNNSQPTGCLFKLDSLIPVMKHYNDGTGEGWLKGEWVEKDGIYSLSVAGTPSEKNYTNPDITNPTDRAKYWKYSFT